ncbi:MULTISPECIES: amino acid adenylation domain-containing protein [unclassified Cryobacterium]|uniref:amino acid adenylation domain-containing protein n=1 Tax=unclassified Cryobacterium TaxID=2649013 RepID=UPI0018CAF9EA|nr:amino acid adenylation domain-containing protein [Cryobacterium sp. CAN_C3]
MFGDVNGTYNVVTNHLGKMSIWPIARKNAPGWRADNFSGSKQACLEHIDVVWQDLRPNNVGTTHSSPAQKSARPERVQYRSAVEGGSPEDLPSVPEIFATMARKQPHSVAIVDAHESWTFERLLTEVETIAVAIKTRGLRQSARVGVLLSRSNWFAAAALGVMRAGHVIVPLDGTEPVARLQTIVTEADLDLILVDSTTATLGARLGNAIPVDSFARDPVLGTSQTWPNLREMAYIVFTSGSTGTPKGVVVSHLAFANLVASHQERHHAQARKIAGRNLRIAHTTSVAFDLSWDAFAWMLSGHTVYMVPDSVRRDLPALVEYLMDSRIDVMECTPSQLEQMLTAGYLAPGTYSPTLIAVGGESVSPDLWSFLRDAAPTAYNFYGPTEFAVDALVSEIVGSRPVVGYPQANCHVRILDPDGSVVPDGAPGEIYLGGPQLAIGYLNAPALTAERFVPDAYSKEPGSILYRTGDLGRLTDDGVEFLGRADRQVKVRGLRIELGEIESNIRDADGVINAVVLPILVDGRVSGLSGFVVLEPDTTMESVEDFVESHLPNHMVPATMTAIVQIPLRSSGKVDEAALRELETAAELKKLGNRPEGDLETTVAALWSEVLGHRVNNRQDNFFCVGGHSLSAVQLMARVNAVFHTSLSLSLMFETPTIHALSLAIEREKPKAPPPRTLPL